MQWVDGAFVFFSILSVYFWLASAFQRLQPIKKWEPRTNTAVSELSNQLIEIGRFNSYAAVSMALAVLFQVISFWVHKS
jgi:hypothetical protein